MRVRATVAAVALSVLSAISLAGCFGSGRSAEAVCKVFNKDGKAFMDHYNHLASSTNDANVLFALADLAGAPGRLADLMGKFAAAAPKDIEPDFQTLADAFHEVAKSQGENALHPLKALANSLALGINTQGAMQRTGTYLREHCGEAPK
jgi:hypothetical protein